jgi:hypothetical protein
MYLTPQGTVGIGTTSPGQKVEINTANGTEAALRIFQTNQNYWDLKIPASTTRFVIGDISGDYVTFLNGGNVGVGTTNPGQKLDVSGSIRVRGGSGSGSIEFTDNTPTPKWRIDMDLTANTLDFNYVG